MKKGQYSRQKNGSGKYMCIIQISRVHVTDLAAKAPFIYW